MAKAKTPRTNTTRNKQVIQMPDPGSTTVIETRKTSAPVDIQDEIRRRAYALYEQRGCAPGHENEDWEIAEREILMRFNQQQRA